MPHIADPKRPVLDKGFVRYIDHMGSDLTVVNAARVSFAKESRLVPINPSRKPDPDCPDCKGSGIWAPTDYMGGVSTMKTCACLGLDRFRLSDKDARLIGYLARHNHWTPFGHCTATFHIKMPIFVARQWMRSNIGIVYNEVSRRYVDDEPDFYEPVQWRPRPEHAKQGSGLGVIPYPLEEYGICPDTRGYHTQTAEYQEVLLRQYRQLLKLGVAPEMARMVLPLSMYTEVWMTASLAAYARVCQLRLDPHAQWETRQYAGVLADLCGELWPVSWAALRDPEQGAPNEAS